MDCLASCACACCTLIQQERETEARGPPPGRVVSTPGRSSFLDVVFRAIYGLNATVSTGLIEEIIQIMDKPMRHQDMQYEPSRP